MPEMEMVQPLDSLEIKTGIVHKILEAVDAKLASAIMESLGKTCRLYGVAYPKFKAKWSIHVDLDDFGRMFEADIRAGLPVQEFSETFGQYMDSQQTEVELTAEIEVEGEIPETPPNQFRRETEQGVPTMIQGPTGNQEQKSILYQKPRRTGRVNRE